MKSAENRALAEFVPENGKLGEKLRLLRFAKALVPEALGDEPHIKGDFRVVAGEVLVPGAAVDYPEAVARF